MIVATAESPTGKKVIIVGLARVELQAMLDELGRTTTTQGHPSKMEVVVFGGETDADILTFIQRHNQDLHN